MEFKHILLLTFLLPQGNAFFGRERIHGPTSVDLSDSYLSTPQIIEKYGGQFESHQVISQDGYILTLHRIKGPSAKPPVLLVHGILGSSKEWVLPATGSPKDSLPFKLSAEGYDIYLYNGRGNHYSMRHQSFDANSKSFWKFSQDEQAKFDIPATIDYILKTSSQDRLFYIGFSFGSMLFFKSMAIRPDLNPKIALAISYGGAAGYLKNITGLTKVFANFVQPERPLKSFFDTWNHGKMSFDTLRNGIRKLQSRFCTVQLGIICDVAQFLIFGYSPGKIIDDALTVGLTEYPSSTSAATVVQILQGISYLSTNEPASFYDYGPVTNSRVYGSHIPPGYDVRKVTAPVYFFSGVTDGFTEPRDIEYLSKFLPNVKGHKVISHRDSFGHTDFYLAQQAPELVYEPTIKLLKEFANSGPK